MKCLDCGFDVQSSELEEHEGHDIVPGSFNYEEEIREQARRIAELEAEMAKARAADADRVNDRETFYKRGRETGLMQGKAIGRAECIAEVAELQKQVANLTKAVADFENQAYQNERRVFESIGAVHPNWPAETKPEADDDPLTMPVEQLRKCVAIEVMEWRDEGNAYSKHDHFYNHNLDLLEQWTTVCYKSEWRPDTNPADMQMVEDRMIEWGFRYGMGYNKRQPPYWAWFDTEERINKPLPLVEAETKGIAICRAALLAVRAKA